MGVENCSLGSIDKSREQFMKSLDISEIILNIADNMGNDINISLYISLIDQIVLLSGKDELDNILISEIPGLTAQSLEGKVDKSVVERFLVELRLAIQQVQSNDFICLYNYVSDNFPGRVNPSVVFSIEGDNPGLLRDEQFWKTIQKISVDFGIEHENLWSDVNLYNFTHKNPDIYGLLKTHWRRVIEVFPKIPQSNAMLNTISTMNLSEIGISYWEEIRTRKETLIGIYSGLDFGESIYDWGETLKDLGNDKLYTLFTSDEYSKVAISLGTYLSGIESRRMKFTNFFSERSFYLRIVDFFREISVDPSHYIEIYRTLGVDIDKIYFSGSDNKRDVFEGLNIEQFLEDLQGFVGEFPGIIEKSIKWIDIQDLIESFKRDGNLSVVININRELQRAGIEGIELISEEGEGKLLLLQVIGRLNILSASMSWRESIGISLNWNYSLLESAKILILNPELLLVLDSPGFEDFWKNIIDMYPKFYTVHEIPEVLLLYQTIEEDKQQDILFSQEFQEFLKYLGENFQFTNIGYIQTDKKEVDFPNIGALSGILEIYQNFPRDRIDRIIGVLKGRGIQLYANDISLLLFILQDESLNIMLLSGDIEIGDLGEPTVRTIHELLESYKNSLNEARQEGNNTQLLEQNIQAFMDRYNERPNFQDLPLLDRVRIYLISKYVKKERFISEFSHILYGDLHNHTTEYGGIIGVEGKDMIPIQINSTSGENRSYSGDFNPNFHGGLTSFHLHAVQMNSARYSGPSGFGFITGDFGMVRHVNTSDVVFTSLGHPVGEDGTINHTRIRVNIDYYFVDKRDPNNIKQVVYDLGVIEVPYNK